MKVNSTLNQWLFISGAVVVGLVTSGGWVRLQAQESGAAAGNERLQGGSREPFEAQLRRQIQSSSPFLWQYLVELERYQRSAAPDLQQQAEAEILELLQRPQPLQQRLIEQQGGR